jgi:hypothetical protein
MPGMADMRDSMALCKWLRRPHVGRRHGVDRAFYPFGFQESVQ